MQLISPNIRPSTPLPHSTYTSLIPSWIYIASSIHQPYAIKSQVAERKDDPVLVAQLKAGVGVWGVLTLTAEYAEYRVLVLGHRSNTTLVYTAPPARPADHSAYTIERIIISTSAGVPEARAARDGETSPLTHPLD